MSFPVPDDEPARLAALHRLRILDTAPEGIYDDIVALAAAICRTQVAVINFVDHGRQWGKALVGLEDSEAPRDISFCARAVASPDGMLVVPDAHADPDWADNPMVTDGPVRFYAGVAIVDEDGHALGTVCVADPEAREADEHMLGALRTLARQAASHLTLRRKTAELNEANEILRRIAGEDPLTGLANRTVLNEQIERELARRTRTGLEVGVLFGDLNNLKTLNDTHGHDMGDLVLRTVAQRLDSAARGLDTVARVSGDEFVVLCPDLAAPSELGIIAHRLGTAVSQPLELADGTEYVPAISLGWAWADDGDTPATLLKRADDAMYTVKVGTRSAAR